MKKVLFFIAAFCGLTANAQNFLISFAGSGASTSVSSVKVENLTKNTSLTLYEGDILLLTATTGIYSIEDHQSSELKIYPNPMTDNSTLLIYPPEAGNAVISVLDITGKQRAQIKSNLENVRQDFTLSGIKSGFYLINVKGNNYQFSGKLLSKANSSGTISIEKVNSIFQAIDEKVVKDSKGTQATVEMAYTTGDRLKFTGISGIYSTIIIDILSGDKTINFNFIACNDGDYNNYPVVTIGTQIWMAENLKTTKYRNGDLIGTTTPATLNITGESNPKYQWAYDGNESNGDIYGRLYTWHAVTDLRNVCPTGWSVPTEAEWTTLTGYLTNNGYGYQGSGSDIAKSMASTSGWTTTSTAGTIGNDMASNNSSGFTALPGGSRPYSTFNNVGNYGFWWTVTDWVPLCAMVDLEFDYSSVRFSTDPKYNGLSVRCLIRTNPLISTSTLTYVTAYSATVGGNVSSEGNTPVTERGVYWGTSQYSETTGTKLQIGSGTGSFSTSLSGLNPSTHYYVKAYAINSSGTSYGDELCLYTRGEIIVSDIDGNTYTTTVIGTQTWMAENLKTTKYNDGTAIPLVTGLTAWSNLTTPGYCWYNDNATYKDIFGALYNWYAVKTAVLCPTGWHVPTDTEWTTLTTFLGGESVAGNKLKETGSTHWQSSNAGATNETGFTALPGGYRTTEGLFTPDFVLCYANWWSTMAYNTLNAWYRYMRCDSSFLNRDNGNNKQGFSVRCLMN